MTGSVAVVGVVAQAVFLALLVVAGLTGRMRLAALFCVLWMAGFTTARFVPDVSGLFTPYVAVLAIALLFIVFKGDVPLS